MSAVLLYKAAGMRECVVRLGGAAGCQTGKQGRTLHKLKPNQVQADHSRHDVALELKIMRPLQAGQAGAAGQTRTPRSGAVPVPGGDHRAPAPPPACLRKIPGRRGRGLAGDVPHTTAGPTTGRDMKLNINLYGYTILLLLFQI